MADNTPLGRNVTGREKYLNEQLTEVANLQPTSSGRTKVYKKCKSAFKSEESAYDVIDACAKTAYVASLDLNEYSEIAPKKWYKLTAEGELTIDDDEVSKPDTTNTAGTDTVSSGYLVATTSVAASTATKASAIDLFGDITPFRHFGAQSLYGPITMYCNDKEDVHEARYRTGPYCVSEWYLRMDPDEEDWISRTGNNDYPLYISDCLFDQGDYTYYPAFMVEFRFNAESDGDFHIACGQIDVSTESYYKGAPPPHNAVFMADGTEHDNSFPNNWRVKTYGRGVYSDQSVTFVVIPSFGRSLQTTCYLALDVYTTDEHVTATVEPFNDPIVTVL